MSEIQEGSIIGQVGFGADKKGEMLTKDETIFQVDGEGKALPEKCPVYCFDRDIERELVEETVMLMELTKKKKAVGKTIQGFVAKWEADINALKGKVDAETNPEEKAKLDQLFK